ncbi:MAG: hypothetical protein AAFX87_31375 [Bacteroidota bacterium]
MELSEIEYIEQTIDFQNDGYTYYKDKYACDLLSYYIKESASISQLKKSSFGFLLDKPPVKHIAAKAGDGRIFSKQMQNPVYDHLIDFKFGRSRWGEMVKHRNNSWFQTSRPGFNFVLQLNFGVSHNQTYFNLVKPDKDEHPFVFYSHPVATKRNLTMAWARLDIDLEQGQVLIEEIQNDWLREVKRVITHLNNKPISIW